MCLCRIHKNQDHIAMSTKHLKDKRLSWEAKGLLGFMLSLPDDVGYTPEQLADFSNDSVEYIKKILKELTKYGYLTEEE